jgi:Cu2+-exporting ATPase
LRRVGLFIRNAELWAKLDRVRNVIFDKTGTLTLETISLRNPEALHGLTDDEREVLLAMVHDNAHPVSGCLREQLLADGVRLIAMEQPREVLGIGLEINHAHSLWRLGRPEWTAAQCAGECVFTRNHEPRASFVFGEEPRPDAVEEVSALASDGCRVFILSGDRSAKVAAMADHLGLPQERCLGEMSPQEKADWVERFDAHDTLYLGDGANDSFAFDAAWCSGTPAVDRGLLEQKADFYFLGRGLGCVRTLLRMAATRRRISHAVVAFAIAYNSIAILLCLAGKMSPLLAAVLMPASSLVTLAIVFAGFRSAPDSLRSGMLSRATTPLAAERQAMA